MSVWEALILGVVQGITEFLPVSSSGHLVLLQKIFGITEPALIFDTALHGGTLLAVLVVLRRDILNILRRIAQPMTMYLIIATIPAVIIALLFGDQIEEFFHTGFLLGFAFLVTSCLLLVSDRLYGNKRAPGGSFRARTQKEMNWKDALFIGLFQAVAIVPGISRSGATISAAMSRKLDREFAVRFSFLLSIPAILGALFFQIINLVKAGSAETAAAAPAASTAVLPLLTGTISACIVAFFSIRLTLRIVRERSLKGFALYTGILGLLVLGDQFISHFFF